MPHQDGNTEVDRRIRDFVDYVSSWIGEIWDFRTPGKFVDVWSALRSGKGAEFEQLEASRQRILARLPPGEAARSAAETYFYPARWRVPGPADANRQEAIRSVLEFALVRDPPEYLEDLLEARIRLLLAHWQDAPEIPGASTALAVAGEAFYAPRIWDCVRLLGHLPDRPGKLRLVERFVSGELNFGPFAVVSLAGGTQTVWAYEVFDDAVRSAIFNGLFVLAQRHRLTRELYARCLRAFPGAAEFTYHMDRRDPEIAAALDELSYWQARQIAEDLSTENHETLKKFRDLRGPVFLLLAARNHRDLGLGTLQDRYYAGPGGIETAVVHLAKARDVEPRSPVDRMQVLAELRTYPASTLKALLPVADHGRAILCEALGWEAVVPLVREMDRTAGRPGEPDGDVRANPDPAAGVVDVGVVRGAIMAAPDTVRTVVALYRAAKVGMDNTLTLVEAVGGWNDAKVRRGLDKRNQVAVRAYGLLPLGPDSNEVLTRFAWLKSFEREAHQFGPTRQASETAAAAAALENLARNAGFPDSDRLQWAMEARSPGESLVGRTWEVEGVHAELVLVDAKPKLAFRRDAAPMRSPPPAVRKSPTYAEMQEALGRVKEQVGRIRTALERLMVEEVPFGVDDLRNLARQPTARELLIRLVLGTGSGTFGLLDPDAMALIPLDGASVPISGPVRVVHAYRLQEADLLAAWRDRIEGAGIVQPFPQVAREVYILTQDEGRGDRISRFSARTLDSRVVSRLLQERHWILPSSGDETARRLFAHPGIQAVLEFPDAGNWLTATETVTSGAIWFAGPAGLRAPPLPLSSVPPAVLSDVLRDADLFTTAGRVEASGREPVPPGPSFRLVP